MKINLLVAALVMALSSIGLATQSLGFQYTCTGKVKYEGLSPIMKTATVTFHEADKGLVLHFNGFSNGLQEFDARRDSAKDSATGDLAYVGYFEQNNFDGRAQESVLILIQPRLLSGNGGRLEYVWGPTVKGLFDCR